MFHTYMDAIRVAEALEVMHDGVRTAGMSGNIFMFRTYNICSIYIWMRFAWLRRVGGCTTGCGPQVCLEIHVCSLHIYDALLVPLNLCETQFMYMTT